MESPNNSVDLARSGSDADRPLRVLHGFEEVSGQLDAMTVAQRGLGVEAEAVLFRPHRFGYEDALHGHGQFARRLIAMRRILSRTDVVHLYFGTSLATINRLPDHPVSGPVAWTRRAVSRLFWMRDVPVLKRLGKTVAMTFLGDDVRQVGHMREGRSRSHLDGAHGEAVAGLDARKKRLAALAGIHADLIYATNPDLLEVLPARTRFLPYLLPAPENPPIRYEKAFTVAHAPSNVLVKGTAQVEDAIRQLAGEAEAVRFDLITDVSHAQTLERIGQADVFIDQLKVGWYGVAAVEALSKGCVVLAYLDETDRSRIPVEMNATLPILPVRDAAEIVSVVRRLRQMPAGERAELSRAGMAWARRWHGEAVAAQVVGDYLRVRGDGE